MTYKTRLRMLERQSIEDEVIIAVMWGNDDQSEVTWRDGQGLHAMTKAEFERLYPPNGNDLVIEWDKDGIE